MTFGCLDFNCIFYFHFKASGIAPVSTSKGETGVEQKAFFFQVSNMFTPVQFGVNYETEELCFIIDFKALV